VKIYKGVSEAEYHKVLTKVKWDRKELLDFYLKFSETCLLPWNEFKKKYNPNNPYRKTLTNDFKQVYSPALEGKELIEYDIIQSIANQFNFVKPLKIIDKNKDIGRISYTVFTGIRHNQISSVN